MGVCTSRWNVITLVGLFGACGDPPDPEATTTTSTTTATTMGSGPTTMGPTMTSAASTTGGGTGTTSMSTGMPDSGGSETEGPKFDVMSAPDVPYVPPVIPTTCDEAAMAETTMGCEFFGVDLDTIFQSNQYAIAVANVQEATTATVTVERKIGGMWVVQGAPQMVEANDLYVFNLDDLHLSGTGVQVGGAYRVTSDVPIVVYQFNPLIGGSETSDASMLYPTTSWDTINHVVGWVRNPASNQPAYITIVAAEDGTEVTVTPSAATLPGGPIPAGTPGMPFMFTLDEGDTAEIEVTNQDETLTGTRVTTPDGFPVGVFTGSPCAYVPQGVFACDHLEEQLAGVRLWGTSFVAARLPVREPATPEEQLWQIYASENDTTVDLSAAPGVTGLPASPLTLQAGEMVQFMAAGPMSDPGDFIVDADKPIAILGYMIGAYALDIFPAEQFGDPCTVQIGPTEQFLPRYVVFVPSQWENDYAVITRPAGAQITIDGVVVPDTEFIAVGGTYEVGRPLVSDGVHVIEGALPFGVIISGWDQYDSYAYMGGSGTGQINPNPPEG